MTLTGDCVERMREMAAESVDAVVTDPPYGLEFMGKDWDRLGGPPRMVGQVTSNSRPVSDAKGAHDRGYAQIAGMQHQAQAWHETWAREALRVLKPGGHLLAFGGTRMYHRLACAIEDAGFEIRDCLMWLYGSGFPKSLNVSKAIDKAAGAEREVVGRYESPEGTTGAESRDDEFGFGLGDMTKRLVTAAATPEAERWDGWGTALKPGWEPIVVARKPLRGNVAGNVLAHGTGALNIDGCRVGSGAGGDREGEASGERRYAERGGTSFAATPGPRGGAGGGRWPANLVLSHSEDCVLVGSWEVHNRGGAVKDAGPRENAVYGRDARDRGDWTPYGDGDGLEQVERWACVPGCPVRMLDDQSGKLATHATGSHAASEYSPGGFGFGGRSGPHGGSVEGASRFFYCAKTSRAERNAGLDDFEVSIGTVGGQGTVRMNPTRADGGPNEERPRANVHPTVKPIEVMRWLARLVTPPGGTILDPFLGSGTTGAAAALEGFEFVGIEREPEYVAIAEARIRFWSEQPTGSSVAAAVKKKPKRQTAESGDEQLGFMLD